MIRMQFKDALHTGTVQVVALLFPCVTKVLATFSIPQPKIQKPIQKNEFFAFVGEPGIEPRCSERRELRSHFLAKPYNPSSLEL